MIRSLGIVVRRAPYGTINAGEALRHASGGITFGVATTLIFMDDGVFAACSGQDGARIDFTSLSQPLGQLIQQQGKSVDGQPLKGSVVAHRPSLEARGLPADRLVDGVVVMDDEGLANLLSTCDAVLTY